ncbi:MAG: aldo/keto reductase [Pseudomonadota bacterium]
MPRIKLAETLEMSRMAYGMWRLDEAEDISAKATQAKVEACLAQGLTTLDQADIYGGYTAEAIFGQALKAAPSLRDQIELVTKCGIVAPVGRHSAARVKHYDTTEAHITASVEASLTAMHTDHVDLLLIHRPDPFMDADETGAALDALVASGKVRHVGVSNFRPHDFSLLQSRMSATLVTNQIELSLLARDAFTNGDIAFLQERKAPPMAWSPLGGGSLFSNENTGLSSRLAELAAENVTDTTAIAIAWLLAHPAHIIPVMGTNQLDRIMKFDQAFKVAMDRQNWFELYTLATGAEVP